MWGLGKAQPTSLDEAVGGHQGRSECRDMQGSERDDESGVVVLHFHVHEACPLDLVRRAVGRVDERMLHWDIGVVLDEVVSIYEDVIGRA